VVCSSTGTGGGGCSVCAKRDPLWKYLGQREQYNSKKATVHFPKGKVFLLPVLKVSTGEVRVLKGGNQTFEQMDKWYDTQTGSNQDLSRCEWSLWKTGQKERTKYESARLDATAFTPTQEQLNQAKLLMAQAMADLKPMPDADFDALVSGDQELMATADAAPGATQVQASTPPAPQPAVDSTPPWDPPAPQVPVQAPRAQAAPTPAPRPPSGNGLSSNEFSVWVASQPEFTGAGMIQNLIPAVKAKINDINYQKCSPEQLVDLKAHLQGVLDGLRGGR
jgi:hypothetical protein